jgi:hypothetical protein
MVIVAGDRGIETLIQSLTRPWAGVPPSNNHARGDSRVYGLWRGEGLVNAVSDSPDDA